MSLPSEIAGHLNLEGPPATPRPSATVLLARDGDPWELLLVHRPGGADFAPGAYVFPGGSVHDDDRFFEDEIRAAAVREVFEEVGILLAHGAAEAECRNVAALLDAGSSFGEALRHAGLRPDFESLVLFARWITPAQLRRRFDARFYVTRAPTGQSVHPQESEVTDWVWISPRDALESPDITLVYATRAILESVADAPNVDTLLETWRGVADVPVVEPRIVQTAAGWEVVRD